MNLLVNQGSSGGPFPAILAFLCWVDQSSYASMRHLYLALNWGEDVSLLRRWYGRPLHHSSIASVSLKWVIEQLRLRRRGNVSCRRFISLKSCCTCQFSRPTWMLCPTSWPALLLTAERTWLGVADALPRRPFSTQSDRDRATRPAMELELSWSSQRMRPISREIYSTSYQS